MPHGFDLPLIYLAAVRIVRIRNDTNSTAPGRRYRV